MLESFIILLASLAVLAKASEVAIKNAVIVSEWLRITELAVGFVLIAVTTSLPELVVSIFAALGAESGIVVGNVFGSNIANTALIIGAGSLIAARPLRVRRPATIQLARFLLIASLLPLVMLLREFSTRWFGLFLVFIFVAFAYLTLKREIALEERIRKVAARQGALALLLAFIAIFFVIASANYAVEAAIKVADFLNVTKTVIGATIIAVGTSLPEIAVSIAAIKKRRVSLALGNVLGSSVVNLTLVLGTGMLINPYIIAKIATFLSLIVFSLIVNVVTNYFLHTNITYKEGFVLLAVYILFLIAIVEAEIA